MKIHNLIVDDLEIEVLPGGAGEQVLHVPAIIAVVVATWSSPAY